MSDWKWKAARFLRRRAQRLDPQRGLLIEEGASMDGVYALDLHNGTLFPVGEVTMHGVRVTRVGYAEQGNAIDCSRTTGGEIHHCIFIGRD